MEAFELCFIIATIPLADGAIPGTFFWKPRTGIDLTIPTKEAPKKSLTLPTDENIIAGLVVMVQFYEVGATIAVIDSGISDANYPHLNPTRGYFYTNSYRWALRHLKMLPNWLADKSNSYPNTHKVWYNRFHHMDDFLPSWMRYALPFVSSADWNNEKKELRRFQKFSEHAFAKYNDFPHKTFNKYKTFEEVKSKEDSRSSSFHSSLS